MPDRPESSEVRRILIEKYLRGDPPQAALAASAMHQDIKAEMTGLRERVTTVQTGGSRPPFFYLHGDWTGKIFYCYPLARDLGPDQPFYLLEPYTFDGLPALPTFEAMAAAHLKSMRTIQPEGPYFLGGWCNGGLIAYEMARQLHAEGQKVSVLVLLDSDGPHPAYRRLIRSVITRFCKLVGLGHEKQVDLFLLVQHIYRYLRFSHYRQLINSQLLETDEQREPGHGHSKESSAFGGLRREVLIPKAKFLRQDWASMYEWIAYGYKPSLYPGKITFLWDGADVWRQQWWHKVIEAKANEVDVHVLPGTHYTLRTEDVHLLSKHLRECLRKAQSPALNEQT